ncbi:MAG: hypothetical protein JWO30_3655 [Fibrobacteres bacterium]|nr:hypothetical protein [Fibrobacterota bacterium]
MTSGAAPTRIRTMDFIDIKKAIRIAVLAPACIYCAEDYAGWSHQAGLRLDTSPAGADVSGPVAGFPLLVRLSGGEFPFSQALRHGEDVRFSDTDGKHLPYQIDRWDSASGAAEIWVKVDSIQGNTSGQSVRMYWGKTGAADSSKGSAVFGSANGYVAAWHLGGTGSRPNAVAGGAQAVPHNYVGSGSVAGMIGQADTLRGGAPGSYLDIGDGYTEFTAGFTFSAWIYSSAVVWYSHFLDLGNGQATDNILLSRYDTTPTAAFDNYQDTAKSTSVHIDNALIPDKWQYCAVTVQGKNLKYYLDGVLLGSDTLSLPISNAFRTENFLGKSNWPGDLYFQGMYDEVSLAKIDRSADWVRLSYANQKKNQNLVTFVPGINCASRFDIARDTTVPEGSQLKLAGTAACASHRLWSVVDGPGPRIFDPEAETLLVFLPRVSKDTAIKYQFSADFGDSAKQKSVVVHVRNTVPDPIFTLPPSITWDGKDSLPIKPVIENLSEILASTAPALHYQWTVDESPSEGPNLDPATISDLLFKDGEVKIGLCLDNGGPPACKATLLTTGATSSLLPKAFGSARPEASRKAYDSKGRRMNPPKGLPVWIFLASPAPGP